MSSHSARALREVVGWAAWVLMRGMDGARRGTAILSCRDQLDSLGDVFRDGDTLESRKRWAIGKLMFFIRAIFKRRRQLVRACMGGGGRAVRLPPTDVCDSAFVCVNAAVQERAELLAPDACPRVHPSAHLRGAATALTQIPHIILGMGCCGPWGPTSYC